MLHYLYNSTNKKEISMNNDQLYITFNDALNQVANQLNHSHAFADLCEQIRYHFNAP